MKRLFSCFLAIVLVVGMVPTAAWGEVPGLAKGGSAPSGAGAVASDAADSVGGAMASMLASSSSTLGAAVSGMTAKTQELDANGDGVPGKQVESMSDEYVASSIGIGGHGAPFDPVISSTDPRTFVVGCDMGGLYVTHDEGYNWDIKSCNGRIWDIDVHPTTGTFYAGGSGLWRSQDDGDTWDLLWPKPEAIERTAVKQQQTRLFYYTSDSYPNEHLVEAIATDAADPNHIVVTTSGAPSMMCYKDSPLERFVYESVNGGDSFSRVASFRISKEYPNDLGTNAHVFVESAADSAKGRIIISYPDGIFEVDRANQSVRPLYKAPGAERIADSAQVCDEEGTHYIVMETANTGDDAAAFERHTRIKFWHTTDFNTKVDLTSELVNSLPRDFNTVLDRNERTDETSYTIKAHNAIGFHAASMDRIYVSYQTRDSSNVDMNESFTGISGLVTYDATKSPGSRFAWTYGLRLWWEDQSVPVTPDQNMLMERAHCDSSFAMLGIAADPHDPKRIVLTTHATLLFSPDIDVQKLYSAATNRNWVNLYPRYARLCDRNPEYPTDPGMGRMRSTGLEVTVAYRIATDPFDPKHLMLQMDDAGTVHSYDGGDTWYSLYRNRPSGMADSGGDIVFDEGKRGVVYALWHYSGAGRCLPSARLLADKGAIMRSTDGGKTWESFSKGIPDKTAIVDLEIVYPRDSQGNITDGERTMYVATMGRGFFVSRDSGATFTPMNAGIPTVATAGVDAVWAGSVKATADGRLFGLTRESLLDDSVNHWNKNPDAFGNIWEWDATANGGAGSWVRLPFNERGPAYDTKAVFKGGLHMRAPAEMYYDDSARTLYVAAQCSQGPNAKYGDGTAITNFGGGLYAYTSSEGSSVGAGTVVAIDANSALLGNESSLSGVGRDTYGRMWIATTDGDVYMNSGVKSAQDAASGWQQVLSKKMCLCFGFDFGPDGIVYFLTRGTGSYRIAPTFAPQSTTEAPNTTTDGSRDSTEQAPTDDDQSSKLPDETPDGGQNSIESAPTDAFSQSGIMEAHTGKLPVIVSVSRKGEATLKKAGDVKSSVTVNTVKLANGATCKVTKVSASAFKGSKATKVTLGANVSIVGAEAFANCKQLRSVSVGKNVKTLGASVFSGCKKLKSVAFGKNVRSVGKGAFKGCKKLKVLKVRSAKLTKKSCKQMLKGSSVRTVKLVGLSKAKKAKVAAKYAKWLPKGVVVR